MAEETRQQNERLAREREADSATEMLRETQLATQNFSGPVADAASRVMSEAEAEMWDDYRMNGAAFSAGDECESTEVPLRQLCEEAESFGLWNPEATARKLGFDDGQGVAADEDDDEDDFLAEFMRNIGEFCPLQPGCVGGSVKRGWFGFNHMTHLIAANARYPTRRFPTRRHGSCARRPRTGTRRDTSHSHSRLR